jgi:hypothetical protein
LFRDVDADFYLMVDGGDTYDASIAMTWDAAYRRGHR